MASFACRSNGGCKERGQVEAGKESFGFNIDQWQQNQEEETHACVHGVCPPSQGKSESDDS